MAARVRTLIRVFSFAAFAALLTLAYGNCGGVETKGKMETNGTMRQTISLDPNLGNEIKGLFAQLAGRDAKDSEFDIIVKQIMAGKLSMDELRIMLTAVAMGQMTLAEFNRQIAAR